MIESSILAATYFDNATICRFEKVKDENGVTVTKEVIVYENIPCAISKNGLNTIIANDISSIKNTYTMFYEPQYKLKPGDKIIATLFNGDKVEYTSGTPFAYISHNEVSVEESKRI